MQLPNTSRERGEITMRNNAKVSQMIAKILIWIAALLVIVVLVSILIYILIKGIPKSMAKSKKAKTLRKFV